MRVKTFSKGIHPEEFKWLTEKKELERLPLPKEVFIPLQQHVGSPCKPIVENGMEVKTGQIIGENTGFISSNIHASISGKVKAIDNFTHPLDIPSKMIHIIGDGNDDWIKQKNGKKNWDSLDKNEIIDIIKNAGIVGLGGAAFPTYVKINPPKDKKIDTFILNGCECEPYLTADHRLMVEESEKIILGVRILMKALEVSNAIIGIEDNKPDAIKMMEKASSKYKDITVIQLKTKYPQGAEKMLIKATLDREVPAGGLPMDVGVIVNNVGTALAVAEAVTEQKPLLERVVTVTGSGIKEPKNLIVRIGTPFRNLIDYCGGLVENTTKILMGGPMMGVTQHSLDVPIIKATSGILCMSDSEVIREKEFPCIQCGACVNTCPMNLLPTRLAKLSQREKWEDADNFGILSCIECGSCAFVCPSKIPLVQWIKIGKLRVNEMKRKKKLED